MNLVKLGRSAIEARRLDGDTFREMRRLMDSRSHLSPEEYETLRSMGRAVKSGEVVQVSAQNRVRKSRRSIDWDESVFVYWDQQSMVLLTD